MTKLGRQNIKAKEVYSKRTRGNMSIADQEPGLIRRQWLLIS